MLKNNKRLQVTIDNNFMKKITAENQILSCNLAFMNKQNLILSFRQRNLYLDILKYEIIDQGTKSVTDLIKNVIETEESLKEYGKEYNNFFDEIIFKSYYQSFEELISELFQTLLYAYPIFLKKDNDKIEIEYDLIFNHDDIDYTRRRIVEKRARKYIQSNNIIITLSKFKTVFGEDIELSKDELKILFIGSRIRNILTHNNGIINHDFIEDVKEYSNKYAVNTSVYSTLKDEITVLGDTLREVGKRICETLIKKIPQIDNYSKTI